MADVRKLCISLIYSLPDDCYVNNSFKLTVRTCGGKLKEAACLSPNRDLLCENTATYSIFGVYPPRGP
jgi:hypothetical protein